MEEVFPNQDRHNAEQEALEQAEVIINGQVYRRTVLPAFTREDAAKKHRAMMRTYMNDTRYVRDRDPSVDVEVQDNYYDS